MREDAPVDFALLAAYLALPIVAYLRVRSLAWTAIALTVAVSFAGGIVGFVVDHGGAWTRPQLQVVLLAALLAVVVAAVAHQPARLTSVRRQLLAVGLPTLLLFVFFLVMTTWWTDAGAFRTPVGFLMGHAIAEDNAKWLDFTAQFAAGGQIHQAVSMGGPLQLVLTFVGTGMGAMSQLLLGGYNEVAVAANTVIYAQFGFAIFAPLALAPLAEARVRSADRSGRITVPAPYLWVAALVLVAANLVATGYGHLTFQYIVLIAALWSSTFVAKLRLARVRLLMTLAIALSMLVWLPMNVLAALVIVGVPIALFARGVKTGRWAWAGVVAWLVTVVVLWEPLRSSFFYALTIPGASGVGGAVRGVTASVPVAVVADLVNSGLFAAGGGTDQVQPILAVLAGAAGLGAAWFVSRQPSRQRIDPYLRMAPVGALVVMALVITVLDAWVTGGGPHYGSLKFTFMASIVVLATCLPFALLLIDPSQGQAMSTPRWVAVAGVVMLLTIDTLLPHAIAAARPQQWSPAVPFNNPQSYWWPAEVNGTGKQPIARNPVGCVYLPQGAVVPSGLLVSELSDPQRVYSCTRLLSGLAGADSTALPLVEWLRREWTSNTPAWEPSWTALAGMQESVLDKPVILLDDGSNVIGLESVRSLLNRFPAEAGLKHPRLPQQ